MSRLGKLFIRRKSRLAVARSPFITLGYESAIQWLFCFPPNELHCNAFGLGREDALSVATFIYFLFVFPLLVRVQFR